MGKEEIKNLLENSKRVLQEEHDKLADGVKTDLKNYKKKTLEKV